MVKIVEVGKAAQTEKITQEGFAAAKNGKNYSDNPYAQGTPEYHWWLNGWGRGVAQK